MTKTSFVTMNNFIVTNSSFFMTDGLKQSTTSSKLDFFHHFAWFFLLNLQNISKWRIRAFLRDIGVNIALKLYKKYEKHTINANKIHTYQGGGGGGGVLNFGYGYE